MVSDNFKQAIASTFYDKVITTLSKDTIKDAEGGRRVEVGEPVGKFKGNVNFKNLKEIQEQYGLDYKIDIAITTDHDGVEVGDIIKYLDGVYSVSEARPFDSHIMIMAVKYGD